MAEKYGKTWWGSQWLNALSHIDYSNRLPRGASYARKGAVEDLEFEGNKIYASVQGSSWKPYDVRVELTQWTAAQIRRFEKELELHPSIVAAMMRRELLPAVVDIAEQCGLDVFPHSWHDLRMRCSCPDVAVPCKHIAAVIYLLANEIDNNPFLIFELHGMDLLAWLDIDEDQIPDPGFYRDLLTIETASPDKNDKNKSKGEGGVLSAECNSDKDSDGSCDATDSGAVDVAAEKNDDIVGDEISKPDFSALTPIGPLLYPALPDAPPFSSKNFKEIFIKYTREIAKKASRGIYDLTEGNGTPLDISLRNQPILSVDEGEPKFIIGKKKITPVAFVADLAVTSWRDIKYMGRASAGFAAVAEAAARLMAMQALAPKIVKNPTPNKDGYAIVWLPLMSDKRVAKVIAKLNDILPLGSVVNAHDKAVVNRAEIAVGVFVGAFLSVMYKKSTGSKLEDMFFGNRIAIFQDFGEREHPGGIKAWVDHFSAGTGRWIPVLQISDKNSLSDFVDGFTLSIKVADKEKGGERASLATYIYGSSNESRCMVMKSLSLLSSMIPHIDYLIDNPRKKVELSNDDFIKFVSLIAPAVEILGIEVALPKGFKTLIKPLPSITIRSKQSASHRKGIRLDDLLDFDWAVAIDDNVLSVDEFEALSAKAGSLIRYKGQYIHVTAEDLRRLAEAFNASKRPKGMELLRAAISGNYDGVPSQVSEDAIDILNKFRGGDPIAVSSSIQATLRKYQERGYEWMYRNLQLGFGSIIADDMGLGKTLQVITLLQKLKDEGNMSSERPAIVIVPTGLLTNWQKELTRFAPELNFNLYHGPRRSLKEFSSEILLTSYGVVRSDIDKLRKIKFAIAVIDEAQNIKNTTTAQTKAVKSIAADCHIAMSGTPVENRLSEYWSIMDFANKGYLGSLASFNRTYASAIEGANDQSVAALFRRIVAPFMLRRVKTDKSIISDLPEKIETNYYAVLEAEQAALYNKVLEEAMALLEQPDDEIDESKRIFRREGIVLQMILALKQVCNHPSQFLKDGQFTAEASGKVQALLELIESINEAGEKALIFTQFTEMAEGLQKIIGEVTGRTPLYLHGGLSTRQRADVVDRFQNHPADKFFILSLKAGGTGLNLTAANHVIHYDLWWNPAVESQATDRAYRIGQTKNVMVHRLICSNTFEERIDEMIRDKRYLAELSISTGETSIAKLSDKEIRELFSLKPLKKK